MVAPQLALRITYKRGAPIAYLRPLTIQGQEIEKRGDD